MTQDKHANDQTANGKVGQRPTANGQRPTSSRRSERGYILLMLMLFVTLMVIAAGVARSHHCFPGAARSRRRDDPPGNAVLAGHSALCQENRALSESPGRPGKYQQHSLPAQALQGPHHRQGFQIAARGRSPTDQRAGHSRSQSHRGPAPAQAGEQPLLRSRASTMLGGAATQTAPGAATAATASGRARPATPGADATSANPDSPDASKIRLQPGGRDWQRSTLQRGFWRRPHRRRGQHQQGNDDSRIQSQESLQPVAVHLRPNHGPRRPDHHAGAACVAIGSPAAAAEFVFIAANSPGNSGLLLAGCRVRRRRSPHSSNNKNLRIDRDRFDGRGRPSSISRFV